MIRVGSYNLNGIRAAIKKDWIAWVLEQNLDFICIQETKSQPEQVDLSILQDAGYHAYWHSAEKKGYSGVLTLSRIPVEYYNAGMDMKKYDSEGRIMRTDFGDWTLLNCYFPSGSSGEERHQFKMEFLADFKVWLDALKKERKNLIVVGDYNVVHQELDIHNPKRKDNPSGYRPEERAWLSNWFQDDFVDVFRFLNPEKIEFSWWTYRAGARDKNKGWRIDYISVSKEQQDIIRSYESFKDAKHSDHCCIIATLDI